jgi:hypothetical protein
VVGRAAYVSSEIAQLNRLPQLVEGPSLRLPEALQAAYIAT